MKMTMKRTRGNEAPFAPVVHENVTGWGAMLVLVCCEVLFGGEVLEHTDTQVKTLTRVMSCIDVTTFTGTASEMRMVARFAQAYWEGKTIATSLSEAMDEPIGLVMWALKLNKKGTREAVADLLAAKELAEEADCDFEDVLID